MTHPVSLLNENRKKVTNVRSCLLESLIGLELGAVYYEHFVLADSFGVFGIE
jgi:hypothetical protein